MNLLTNKFEWYLKIKPESSLRPGLKIDSNFPRASARLGDEIFVNPFRSQIGGKDVGGHIPLEFNYYE